MHPSLKQLQLLRCTDGHFHCILELMKITKIWIRWCYSRLPVNLNLDVVSAAILLLQEILNKVVIQNQTKENHSKKNCNMVTALQHLLQLGPSFLCSKALMIFIPHQIFRYLCDPRYLSNIQVGTRRKFGGAYKNERGKTFIVVS